jgi:hypothetical protein
MRGLGADMTAADPGQGEFEYDVLPSFDVHL